jgi:phosphatidate phosphatase APP1
MQKNDHPLPERPGLRGKLFHWLGIEDGVQIKVYNGYGHTETMVLYGHVLKLGPKPVKKYRKSVVRNTLALLRLFVVKPYGGIEVALQWEGKTYTTKTDTDGFFRFEWNDEPPLTPGWHDVEVAVRSPEGIIREEGLGSVYVPYTTQYGFISDIDDTFLMSYSSHIGRRLKVLFTQNARSRKPFEGVVRHYQLLALGNTVPEAPNPFFYVSSSEWNLYDYIHEFTAVNGLPRGVFMLNVLKRFSQIFKTGQNNHDGKFTRIVRIMEAYPKQRFVLLGDSSQRDPYIYASIVSHFPGRIHAVYIRDVHEPNRAKVLEVLAGIEKTGVPCCFFKHSEEAIKHSAAIGLIAVKAPA